jgi:Zn-dependent M28 family amino/carboxypeptidase
MWGRKIAAVSLLAGLVAVVPLDQVEAGPKSCDNRTNNTHQKLQECVTVEGVRAHQQALQDVANANGGIRTSGTPGYDASAQYVADQMTAAGYDVTIQPFQFNAFIELGSNLAQTAPVPTAYVADTDYNIMAQSDAGNVTALVTGVDLALGGGAWPNDPSTSSSGCEASDFAGFPAGDIALVQRGACSFGLKGDNAAAAGAVGVIIVNQGNDPSRMGLINGTLGSGYSGGIPVLFGTHPRGQEWAATPGLEMNLEADVIRGEATTFNVLAETPGGDPDNVVMVGAHLDSVNAGPGINDNGSGSSAILETAIQMAKVNPVNKVRFGWWGAEESGLVGSTFYVDNLTQEEQDQIALYLNFDMVGSPNYFFGVYDGDDSDGVGAGPGPEGSAQIEATFEGFYDSAGEPHEGTDFSGRSDYGPFIAVGIPAGGLFTGAEGIKTDAQAAIYGGTAGDQFDPCYHLACDTFDNNSMKALDVNSDAIAHATLQYAMNTELVNGVPGKGNFKQ